MIRSTRLALLAVAVLALRAVPTACAADEPDELMPGKVTVIKPGKLAKFVAKPATGDAFELPGASNDPTVEGGSLRIFDAATTAGDDLYPLPVQPAPLGWKGLGNPAGSKGYKYKGAGTPADPCTVVLIKPKVVKGVCRGASMTLAPPFDGEVGIILTAGTGSKRYCASFGGAEVKNAPELTKRKDAAAAACPTPVPPPPPAESIFVDGAAGNDANPGTMAAPKATVQAGIAAAQFGGVDVYVSVGTYAESITLADGVSVFGGYDAADAWSFSPANVVTISGGPTAVLGTGIDAETNLANLTIVAADSSTPGGSSHGLYIVSSTGLVVTDVTVQGGAGGAGNVGTPGVPGANAGNGGQGNPGCEDSGFLCSSCDQPAGGAQGTSACGRTGGVGGPPGHGSDCGTSGGIGEVGTSGGPGGCPPSTGSPGTPGTPGTSGSHGLGGSLIGTFTAAGYEPADGADGGNGDDGNGGGGGGGGAGGDDDCDSYGSSGGGGGGGGCGGTAGGGGQGGGGSFAVYLWSSSVSLTNVEMRTGNGGAGGDGASGGTGGTGGASGPGGPYGGGSEQDDGSNGGAGGSGGAGGDGGAGGGGGGGPAIGVSCNGSTLALDAGNTYVLGNAGTAGSSLVNPGSAGTQAQKQGC